FATPLDILSSSESMSLCRKAWTLDNSPLQQTPGRPYGFSWHQGFTGGPVLLNFAFGGKTARGTWSFAIMNTSVKWAAELAHVREVSLLGTADLAFWKDRLLKEELLPVQSDGRAQLLIIAADSKFMGVRFRELSFCVSVSRPDGGIRQDAAYLVRAFNSCRFFAFCER